MHASAGFEGATSAPKLHTRQYGYLHALFCAIAGKKRVTRAERVLRPGVRMPLQHSTRWGVQTVTMDTDLAVVEVQKLFLHREARITRVELMDLIYKEFGMPKTRVSYRACNTLGWTLGQKLTLANGLSYWATESQYNQAANKGAPRRDTFLLKGTEYINVKLPNGRSELLYVAKLSVSLHLPT